MSKTDTCCDICNGTGEIELFTSFVPCECQAKYAVKKVEANTGPNGSMETLSKEWEYAVQYAPPQPQCPLDGITTTRGTDGHLVPVSESAQRNLKQFLKQFTADPVRLSDFKGTLPGRINSNDGLRALFKDSEEANQEWAKLVFEDYRKEPGDGGIEGDEKAV